MATNQGDLYTTVDLDNCLSSSGSITGLDSIIPNGGYTVGVNDITTSYVWANTYSTAPTVDINSDGINIHSGGDIKIGGKSLSETINKLEERLGILKPNPELEDRWEQLKSLRQQYMDLEKELLEKEKMWKILKEK